MDKKDSNYNKSLTIEERYVIQRGIENGSRKSSIAQSINKDKSTVGKEIKLHRKLRHECWLPVECSVYKNCKYGRECTPECPDLVPFRCKRRDISPGACNGCSKYSSCRFDKYYYDASDADHEYRMTLKDSRNGVNMTTKEAMEMGKTVKPLIRHGLSPYQILTAHPELGICEKTLYNYIEWHVFDVVGIKDIDLRRKVSRKISRKKAVQYKKRQDRSYLKGRKHDDYLAYMEKHPDAHVVEMDTVYNDISNGPFIQTFKFIGLGLLIALYHKELTSLEMLHGIDRLDRILGAGYFEDYCEVIVTDRGTEFTAADDMEVRINGTRRTHVFYCDPMCSGQKGSLEVIHEQLRYIFPKGKDLHALGLTGQEALNDAISHIGSSPVKSLEGKSAIAYTRFVAPLLWDRLKAFGIREIPVDEVILKPELVKPYRPVSSNTGDCTAGNYTGKESYEE